MIYFMYTCVCPPSRLLIISGLMWCDIHTCTHAHAHTHYTHNVNYINDQVEVVQDLHGLNDFQPPSKVTILTPTTTVGPYLFIFIPVSQDDSSSSVGSSKLHTHMHAHTHARTQCVHINTHTCIYECSHVYNAFWALASFTHTHTRTQCAHINTHTHTCIYESSHVYSL